MDKVSETFTARTIGEAAVLAAARHWYREKHGGNVLTQERTTRALDDAVHMMDWEENAAPVVDLVPQHVRDGTSAGEVERLQEKLRKAEDEYVRAIALKVEEHAGTRRVLLQVREALRAANGESVVEAVDRLRAERAKFEDLYLKALTALKPVEVAHSRIRYLESVCPAPSAAVAAIVEAVVRADLAGAWEVCPDTDPTQLCSHETCEVSRALRAWQAAPGLGAGAEGAAKSLQARIRMQRRELAALTRTLVRERQRFADEDKRLRARCADLEMQVETYAEVVDIEQSLRREGERLDAIEESNRLRARCEELEAELASSGGDS